MNGDRYLRAVLTVIAVALSAIAVNTWMTTMPLSRAEAQSARYEISIPKAWGKVIGFSGGGDILLEDTEGTLRQVESYGDKGKDKDFPRVKVLTKRN